MLWALRRSFNFRSGTILCFCLSNRLCFCFKWHFPSTPFHVWQTYWSNKSLSYSGLLYTFLAGAGGRAGREEPCGSAVVLLTSIHETDWISELLLPKAESFSWIAKVNLSATGISARLSAPLYHLSFWKTVERCPIISMESCYLRKRT